MGGDDRFAEVRFDLAVERLRGAIRRTPLVPFPGGDPRVELRLKLECLQETGSFKARGAWNQVSQLDAAQRRAGVVAASSGNHGKALSWAAARAGVRATIAMPEDAYPNKIAACRELGAEVVLCPTRGAAEEVVRDRVAAGAVLVHPYDAARTVEGQGTAGLEIAEQWPEAEVIVVPVGGGGLLAGCALALRRVLGARVRVLGVEPDGAPTLTRALAEGHPVPLAEVRSRIQGLCPPSAGELPLRIAERFVDGVLTLDDATILAGQARLVREGGWTVEPAGAAAAAVVFARRLPPDLLRDRGPSSPLRVVAVVSGGNPEPEQVATLREGAERSIAAP